MNPKRTIPLLFVCQALYWGAVIIGITLSAIVGSELAPEPVLATLPAGLLTVGAILTTAPVSLLMQRFGRRVGFQIGAMGGVLGGVLCTYSIIEASFVGFCLGNLLLGVYQACAAYYRLAATDAVPAERSGRAVAWVMGGGVLAAVMGPTLSNWSQGLVESAPFAGSYILVMVLSVAATVILSFLRGGEGSRGRPAEGGPGTGRDLKIVVRQPVFIAAVANAGVSHGVMILVMTTTPLAMMANRLLVQDAALVIQWHVLGMFLPAFFSGRLVDRFGPAVVAIGGAAIFLVSISLAASGVGLLNFWSSSMLLGAGWNFMYVAGTTLVTRSHSPQERGRVQGAAELGIAITAAAAAFGSGALLAYIGWSAVNFGALPLLIIAVAVTLWYAKNEPDIASG